MDINTIVNEILNEIPDDDVYVVFALISETKGFADVANYIRKFPAVNKAVFMCETMERLLPEQVIKEMLGDIVIFKSDYFSINYDRLKKVEKIIIPVFPLSLASALSSLTGEGVVSSALCEAVTFKIPIVASVEELSRSVLENPALKNKVESIKNSLTSLGVTFFSVPKEFLEKTTQNQPELEIIGELIEHFTGFCELEEGVPCINCTKCKVRGF